MSTSGIPDIPPTIAGVLDRCLADAPDREALVGRHARFTYAQLDEAADRAAAALWSMGVRAGDRVGMSLPNGTDAIVAFHGAMRLGAIWVGVNRNLAPPEKAYILADAGVSLLLCDPDMSEQVRLLQSDLADLRVIVEADAGDSARPWASALAAASATGAPRAQVDPYAPAGIAYTSGTTGRPKGVVQSQYNLLLPGAALVARRGYGAELRKGDCLPLTILNMMVLTTLLTAQAGGCCVVMDRIDAIGIAEWIRAERVTTWNGVPALLHSLAFDDAVDRDDLASLVEVWSGGDAIPEDTRQRFEAKFGLAPHGTYGLTEAPTVVTMDDPDGHVPEASGRPLPHLEVSIRDEHGPVGPGEVGEICVGPVASGPWSGMYRPMLGYLHHEAATAEALDGGVLHTGDLGLLDENGFLVVRARRNAVIIRGGANVYPAEVERVILLVPGVRACAVFGLADERLGQRVAAAVECFPGATVSEDDVLTRCRAELARYKVPELVVMVEQLPRNAMGKVERAKLAALADDANMRAAGGARRPA